MSPRLAPRRNSAELRLGNLLNAEFTVVSHRGSGPALSDLIGGQTDMRFDRVASSPQQIKLGTLQTLAVLGPADGPALPDVKIMARMGFGDIDGTTYIGLPRVGRIAHRHRRHRPGG